MSNEDIIFAMSVFPDQEPAVLYDIYIQVGRDREMLVETMMNGGQLPDHLMDQ